MSDQPRDDHEITVYYGTTRSIPFDLEASAADSEGATCHVCDAAATVLVQMLDPARRLGDAIYLCDEDPRFASAGDEKFLSTRVAANYESSVSECVETAALMTQGTGRSVRLRDRDSD